MSDHPDADATPTDAPDGPPDPHLSVLTEAQGDRLRQLIGDALAARGVGLREFDRDAVVTDENQVYGLWNLAVALEPTPAGEWPAAVDRHLDRLLSTVGGIEFSADDLDRLLPRLLPHTYLTPAAHPHAVEVIPDVRLVLAVDRPDEVITPSEDELAPLGEPEACWTTAWANLRRLTAETDFETVALDHGAHLIASASYFTATMAMFVEGLLERAGVDLPGTNGVLVAVPCRDVVLVGPLGATGDDVARTAGFLAGVAAEMHHHEPSPLSPLVSWVHRGRWVPLAGPDPAAGADHLRVEVPEDLLRLLERPSGAG